MKKGICTPIYFTPVTNLGQEKNDRRLELGIKVINIFFSVSFQYKSFLCVLLVTLNRMKRIVLLLVLVASVSALTAQTFNHNLDKSLAQAKTEQKNVLMIFSGSDWCKNCIALRKNILKTTDFETFSGEKLVLLELDFPYKKKNKLPKEQEKHNEQLAEKYNKKGHFPAMVLLDANEKVIGRVHYKKNMNAKELIQQINTLTANK